MIISIIGLSGSGKSTQAGLLKNRLGVPILSTGEILREAVEKETVIGKIIKETLESGKWIASEITVAVLKDIVTLDKYKDGFILDGSPRKIVEAVLLEEFLISQNNRINYIFSIDISDEIAKERLLTRATLSGKERRADDIEESIANRIKEYRERENVIKAYFSIRGSLVGVNGDRSVDEIFTDICAKGGFI